MASCCMLWPVINGSHQWLCSHVLLNWTMGVHGARCTRAMAVHHAVGISCQRNRGYRPSSVNIMAQGLSTPDPSLSLTHLSIRSRATTTHYTHHQVSLMVSHNTTLVPSLGLCIGHLWGRPQRWHAKGACATPKDKDKDDKDKKKTIIYHKKNSRNCWKLHQLS